MAMRGIESQIIMQRTGEYMRDAAVAQKRGEMNIQSAAQANEAEAQHFKKYIEKLQKKEDNSLKNNLESQGGGGGAAAGEGRKKQREEQEAEPETKPVEENLNFIDVRI